MKKSMKRLAALMMAIAVLVVSGLAPTVTAEAAAKGPKKLKLSASAKTIYVNDTYKLRVYNVKTSKLAKTVTFKSMNEKVATVSKYGKVTAKATGTATIVVTSKLNKKVTAKCKFTVERKPQVLYLSAKEKDMIVGTKYTVKVRKALPTGACKHVTFKSMNPKVASVDAKGVVTAKKTGKATIVVKSKAKAKTVAKLTVNVYKKPTYLKLMMDSKELLVGDTYTVKYQKIKPMGAYKALKFKTSNGKVAFVNSKGVVKAKKAGTAKIKVWSPKAPWAQDTITIKVFEKPESIKLYDTEKNVPANTTFTLMVSQITPDNAYPGVKFTTSDAAVASVDANGVVTTGKAGTATITVTSKKNPAAKAKCVVNVYDEMNAQGEEGGYRYYTFDKAAKSFKVVYKENETVVADAADVAADVANVRDAFILHKDTKASIEEIFESEAMNDVIKEFEEARLKATLDEVVDVKVVANADGSKTIQAKRNGSWDITGQVYVFGNAEGETNMMIEQVGGAGRTMVIADIERSVVEGVTVITCNADGYDLKVTINADATSINVERVVGKELKRVCTFEESEDSYVVSFNETYATEVLAKYGLSYSIDDIEVYNVYAE